MLERVDEQGRDEPTVLAVLDERLVGSASEQDVADAPDLIRGALAREAVHVDLALPVAKARAGPRAHGAALLAVRAVLGSAVDVEVEGLVDAVVSFVVEYGVGTGDDARGTARAES